MKRHRQIFTVRAADRGRAGFTLIEILVVAGIIAILMGMIGSASFTARQRAYQAQANAEVRELAAAFRAYWLTYGYWPPEVQGFGSDESYKPISRALLRSIMGENLSGAGANTREIVFLQIADKNFGVDNSGSADMFLDPWGNAYQMAFGRRVKIERSALYSSTVAFPMRDRYEYP